MNNNIRIKSGIQTISKKITQSRSKKISNFKRNEKLNCDELYIRQKKNLHKNKKSVNAIKAGIVSTAVILSAGLFSNVYAKDDIKNQPSAQSIDTMSAVEEETGEDTVDTAAEAIISRELPAVKEDLIIGEIENIETSIINDENEKDTILLSEEMQYTQDEILELIYSDEELEKAYNRYEDVIERYSEQMGEDGLTLIKERVSELGGGVVKAIDVLKVLWIESRGKVYEDEDKTEIHVSSTGEAFGPFQLTAGTVDYINKYFNLRGTEDALDVMDPYDNLDACILNLRFLYEKRSKDIEEGDVLPTGDNLTDTVAWSYHDGAWATNISYYGQDYLDKFHELSIVDEHPSVVRYILEG